MLETGEDIFLDHFDHFGTSTEKKMFWFFDLYLLNISMMGIPGEKILQMKKVPFHIWLWVPFLKKLIQNDLAQLQPTRDSNGANLFSNIFKNGFLGGPTIILWSQIYKICFQQCQDSYLGIPNLGVNQFKTGFCPYQLLTLNGAFFQSNFGHFFCTK